MADQMEKVREVYEAWRRASDRFDELMRRKFRGEDAPDDEVQNALHELDVTYKAFGEWRDRIVRRGPKMGH